MAKGDKKKRTINKEFCRHPPWIKDPVDLRQNLRNGFSRIDDAETALIVRIEEACYFFWCCGEIIGERWKDIAAEQLSLFFSRNEGRFNEAELKFLRLRLKTAVETYTNYYSKQFDLSLEQSEENRKNGLRGAHTKYGLDGEDIGGLDENDSPPIAPLWPPYSPPTAGPDFCNGQAIQEEEEEEKEEDFKEKEIKEEYIYNSNGKVLCKRSEVNRFRDSWMRVYGLTSFPLTDDKDTLFMMARCSEEHPEDLDQFIISRKNLFRHDQVFSFLCKRKSQES